MIIGLSGYARAGKDTVADRLVTSHGFTRMSFADALKEGMYVLNPIIGVARGGEPIRYAYVVDDMGLDAAKAAFPEVRALLQRFGTDVGRAMWGEHFWVDRLHAKIATLPDPIRVVIPDCRFPNEAQFVQGPTMKDGGAPGQLWRVQRPGRGPINDHPSEIALDGWNFDRYVVNDKTIAALHEHVDYLVEALL